MAYKISSTFTIELKSPDGVAVLEFKKPLATRILESISEAQAGAAISVEKIREDWGAIARDIVSIEGFEHENGRPVTKEEIVGFDLDYHTMRAIVRAYNAYVWDVAKADPEKKDSTPA